MYYSGEGQWKPELEGATPFPSSVSAWKSFLLNFNREPMELVYVFENPAENLFVPIEPHA